MSELELAAKDFVAYVRRIRRLDGDVVRSCAARIAKALAMDGNSPPTGATSAPPTHPYPDSA